jgi:hypothetical protein
LDVPGGPTIHQSSVELNTMTINTHPHPVQPPAVDAGACQLCGLPMMHLTEGLQPCCEAPASQVCLNPWCAGHTSLSRCSLYITTPDLTLLSWLYRQNGWMAGGCVLGAEIVRRKLMGVSVLPHLQFPGSQELPQ